MSSEEVKKDGSSRSGSKILRGIWKKVQSDIGISTKSKKKTGPKHSEVASGRKNEILNLRRDITRKIPAHYENVFKTVCDRMNDVDKDLNDSIQNCKKTSANLRMMSEKLNVLSDEIETVGYKFIY